MDNTMSSQVDEGQEATTASPQATETTEKSSSQPQETTVNQVETNAPSTSDAGTKTASDYETARQVKRLFKEMQSLRQTFERSSQSAQPQSQAAAPQTVNRVTKEELLADPIAALERMQNALKQELLGEIPKTLTQRDQAQQHERGVQEGWKQIKSNEVYKRDPQGEERINDILTEENDDGSSLQEYSKTNPVHAAKLALAIYKERYGGSTKVNQSAPTKAQMATTATAVNVGGGKSTLDDEARQLQKELMADGSLMNDPAFRARMDAIVRKSKQEAAVAR